MKFNAPINNFTSGEWSPKMRSLVDAQEYGKSCKEITNYFVQMQGGAQYRAGTQALNIGSTYQTLLNNALAAGGFDPSKDFKIIPYSHSNGFNTMVLLTTGNNAVDLLTGQVFDIIGGATTAAWTVKDVQYAQVGDILVLTCASGSFEPCMFYYSPTASSSYYLTSLSSFMTPIISRTRIMPYLPIEALSSNVAMTLVGPGPYVVGGSYSLLSSSAYFNSNMVGKFVRVAQGLIEDGIFKITAFGTSTAVTVQLMSSIASLTAGFAYGSAANPASFWQISAWGNDSGWPRTVVSFQGRLIFGGTSTYPDTLWGSRISSIYDFQEVPDVNTTGVGGYASSAFTSDNSRPFQLRPTVAQSSYIATMSAGKTLSIHTDTAEIVAYGSNGALGPNNVEFTSSTSFGSARTQAVRINGYETFVQANGYKLRDIIYNFNQDQYNSTDLSFLGEHLFIRETNFEIESAGVSDASRFWPIDDILECVKYEGRSSFMFVKTRRGNLRYVTLDREYKVNAWGRVFFGDDQVQTFPYSNAPKVLAIGVASFGAGANTIYVLTKRIFDGVSRVCIETLDRLAVESDNIQPPNEVYNPYIAPGNYLDYSTACTALAATPTTSWSVQVGATSPRYANTTVSVFADGSYIGEVTLGSDNDGAFTLAREASYVTVGFKYKGKLITSGIESGGQFGIPLGRPKRLDKVVTRFYKTGSGKIGRDDQLEEFVMRPASTPMGQPTPYFTGDKEVTFPLGYDKDYSVTIEQDKPYPMYIVSIAAHGMSYD
jgi:hypothetical protein